MRMAVWKRKGGLTLASRITITVFSGPFAVTLPSMSETLFFFGPYYGITDLFER